MMKVLLESVHVKKSLQNEIDSLNQRILKWESKAEAAERAGDKDNAKSFYKQLELVNKQLATLQERLLEKEKYERGQKQAKEHELALVVFQDFEKRDKGPSFSIECKQNDDFLGEAKASVRRLCSVSDDEEVFFCFYQKGVNGRTAFNEASVFWKATVTSCVYFWMGEKPKSPTERINQLERTLNDQARRILHLEATSSNAQDRDKRFAEGKVLHVHEVEGLFTVPVVYDENAIADCCKVPRSPKEKGVQELFVSLLPLLFPSSVLRDCTSPNGISFAGRRHDIDLVLFIRNIISMETVDTPIELKVLISSDAGRRDVVLQLLDRMAYIFDAQLERKVCWGLAFDSKHVVFVRACRDLSFEVTPALELFGNRGHLSLVARFLKCDASMHGFVPVTLPSLWGTSCLSLLAQHEAFSVFALSEDRVAKVGRTVDSMEVERNIIQFVCDSAPGIVCPELFPCDLSTGNAVWPFGFQMARLNVLSVSSEEEIVFVAGQVFWRLAVLHEIGVVHNDVKPSNMLLSNTNAFLCDFGNASKWSIGHPMMNVCGATKGFNVVTGAFERSSMFLCDLEGLYWSVLVLWLQVLDERSSWKSEDATHRLVIRDQFAAGGLVRNDDGDAKRVLPQLPVLRKYLQEQASARKLLDPCTIMEEYLGLKIEDEELWLLEVKRIENDRALLCCPRDVLKWFRLRRSCNVVN
jgi:hypothetical protein